MNNKIKGALLSGLVFPGLGQFIQGRSKAGIVFISVAVLGLIAITYSAACKFMIIIDQLRPQLDSGVNITPQEVIKIAGQIPNNFIDNIGPFIFLGCWLAATINALLYKGE